ncbi:MAG TPA: DUF3108 domain-containing protein [Paraburkholderia sp.]|jgi:hypothetical protein|nr:DUF3108 domain-containing protein [Paraburkholderia sp.]
MSSSSAARPSEPLPLAATHRRKLRWRWSAVLIAVVGAHWLAAQWFERHRDTFKPADAEHAPVQVALLKPERIEQTPAQAPSQVPATPTAKAPAAAPRRRAPAPREHVLTAVRPAQHAPAAVSESTPPSAASDAASTPLAPQVASDASIANAASAANAASGTGTAAGASTGNAQQAAPGVKFSVPPSGDLQYDTFYNGVRNQPGTIHWSSDGHTYQLIVSVPLPFVGTYSYASHGRIDAFGLAPDQYVETHGRRGQDVTVFNRDTKQIAFTRTPKTLALEDGAQDRFSMIMQLASLVRGDPGAYKPGVTRQFYVTDNDSGEIWPIETIGDETVRTDQGFVDARHFMRLPRRAGDQRRLDVWLAPSIGWLPVRFVQTEPNGTQVELLWHGQLSADDTGAANTPAPNPPSGNADSAPTPPVVNPGPDYQRP